VGQDHARPAEREPDRAEAIAPRRAGEVPTRFFESFRRADLVGAVGYLVRRELAPHEKGGATYKRRVYNEKPAHWHRLKAELNRGNLVADQATARQRRGPAAV